MVLSIWDRKSPRHNWQIVCHTDDLPHFLSVIEHHVGRTRAYEEWPRGQVGFTIKEEIPYPFEPSLPRNADVSVILDKREQE